jgi:hypothetical protein
MRDMLADQAVLCEIAGARWLLAWWDCKPCGV